MVTLLFPLIVSKHHGEDSEEKGFFVQEDHRGGETATADII